MSKCGIIKSLGLIVGSVAVSFILVANKRLKDTARMVKFTPRQRLDYLRRIFQYLKGTHERGLDDAMEMAAIATYSKAYRDAILECDKMYDARFDN